MEYFINQLYYLYYLHKLQNYYFSYLHCLLKYAKLYNYILLLFSIAIEDVI